VLPSGASPYRRRGRRGDVLRDRQVRKQSVILEHDADGALVGRQHIDDLVANDDPPLGLSNKAGHDA
jgi:hypothetical protein